MKYAVILLVSAVFGLGLYYGPNIYNKHFGEAQEQVDVNK